MTDTTKKELEHITKHLDNLSISDSDNSLYSKLTNYKEISTKNTFIISHIIESLKLNNANLALSNIMLSKTLEKYKKLYYESQNKENMIIDD